MFRSSSSKLLCGGYFIKHHVTDKFSYLSANSRMQHVTCCPASCRSNRSRSVRTICRMFYWSSGLKRFHYDKHINLVAFKRRPLTKKSHWYATDYHWIPFSIIQYHWTTQWYFSRIQYYSQR